FGTILPVELTNEDIRNSAAYKEYYAVASGVEPPKTKASIRKTQSSSDTTMPPPVSKGTRLQTSAKGDEGPNVEDEDNELYGDVNINLEGQDVQMTDVHTTHVLEDTYVTLTLVNPDGQQQSSSVSSQFVSNMLNPSPDAGIHSLFESTPRVEVPVTTTVEPLLLTAPTLPPPSIPTISQVQQAPAPSLATAPSTSLQDLLNFGSLFGFDCRLKTLEANFSEFMQTNQFFEAVSSIPAQAENEDFLNKLDENIQKIIKEQVKKHIKVQVSKILLKIEKTVNEQLEAEVLTRSSNSSKTSYAIAVDLSELELKKILIEKMEINKSIHISDEQKNLYKALVDAYKCDKIILDTYRDTVTLKRRQDDEDKDKEPSAGSDRRSKRRRAGKEPESTSAPKEKGIQDLWQNKTLPATHESIQPWISNLAKKADSRTSFVELMDTPVDFLAFVMNWLKVDTLTPELLAGPTYELMKGSCKSLVELEFFLEEVYKATTDEGDWNNPEGQQYPHDLLNPLPLIPNSRGRHVIPFDHFINNDLEYLRGGASTKINMLSGESLIGGANVNNSMVLRSMGNLLEMSTPNIESSLVIEHLIVEWHNYKHLDWITVCRDNDKLYKFKEGDLKRLRIQDIKDMLLLLVQGNLINLTVDECFAFNVCLRMFTRSIVIQRRMEDLQLGVESYQKKLNLIKSDTYRSNLKRKEAYTAYSNPRGFIYHNKDKQNSDKVLKLENFKKDALLKLFKLSNQEREDLNEIAEEIPAADVAELETITSMAMEAKVLEVELALLCGRMFLKESDKIKSMSVVFPILIHGSVMASKPKTMQDAVEFATELMDKKIHTFAERQIENKRKQDDNQQQQNKRQNTSRAYTAGPGEKNPYGGSKPLCSKCNYHHDGLCTPKCHKCNRVGHLARDCRIPINVNTTNNQRGTRAGQKATCYECGAQGHFKREFLNLKNNNHGNQGGNGNASAKVYVVGNAGAHPDSNVITGMFLLNNRYAFILFDTGSDRSFVSTAFSS
nr:hypothetical protein [Tanacetum cinerariifolium]